MSPFIQRATVDVPGMGNTAPDHFTMTTVTEDLDWKRAEEKGGFLRRQRQEI